jgi:hypothetical protein
MGVYAGPANEFSNRTDSNRIDASTKLVVQSGLVLNLDAGTSASYVGSGTTWNDISNSPLSSATGALPIYNTYGLVKGTGTRTDSLSSSLQLCIPCGAQSGLDLNDLSVTGRSSSLQTVTNNGVVNTTSTSKLYGGSGNFSGSATQWASVPNDGRYNLASRQYTTIEFWYRCDSTGNSKGILATGSYNSTGWEIYVEDNGGCNLVVWSGTSGIADVRTGTATFGVWHHCAFIINYTAGTTIVTPYLDGVSSGSSSIASAFPNGSANLYIGRRNTWSGGDSGTLYLQDIRVYSTIKYTSNFTPPGNSNNGTLTNGPTYSSANGGSIGFDGSNDYTNHSPILSSGQQRYTISAWWKTSVNNRIQIVWEQNSSVLTTNTRAALIIVNSNWGFNGESNDANDKVPVRVNQWTYGVITIDTTLGTNPVKMYENGSLYWEGNTSGSASNLNVGNFASGLGRKISVSSEYFIGSVATTQIYNRVLTAAEISQNFNALRSRFSV